MNGVRTRRSFRMQLASSPEKIFPLLCPTCEYDWIDTWKCRMIYSDSGHAELDCVFKTDFPSDGPLAKMLNPYLSTGQMRRHG